MNLRDRFELSENDPLIDGMTYGEAWDRASHLAQEWNAYQMRGMDELAYSGDHLLVYLACVIGGFTVYPRARSPKIGRGEPFAVIETSGTTGKAKKIPFTLDGVCGIAESYGRLSGMNKDTHMHHILTMGHNAGFVNTLFAPMMCGGQITVDTFRGIKARSFEGKGNFLVLTPRIASALLKFHKHKDKHPFWNYKTVQTTAERLPDELAHEFLKEFGVRLVDVYGTTELGGPFIVDGEMLPELEYSLDSENGLHVKSPFAMLGHEGWMDTGDVAKVEGGKITVHGRKKQRLGEELELTRKLSQRSVQERTKNPTAPWVVELDPTSACNLVCPDCISGSLLNKGGFDSDRLESLSHEMADAGVKAVVLIGGGEPLAHPAIGRVLDVFDERGVHVGVTTNGTLIDRYQEQLKHTKWMRVSMDAGTPETFLRFRPAPNGVCRFNDIIGQMERFAKVKEGKLGYSFLILSHGDVSNVGDIYEAARVAKETGCDYFEAKASFGDDHYLIRQSPEHMAVAKEQIASARMLSDDNFRVITPSTLEYVLEGKRLHQPKEYARCAISDLRTLVTPSGAYVCPYFRGNDMGKIGDASTVSFGDMWRSREVSVDPSKDCRFHCIRHKSNLILNEGLGEPVDDYDLFI